MKTQIEISPNIETLFGTRDENLRLLEQGLNVAIAMRSDSIEIEGAPSDVARTQQVFADYQHLLRNGFTFVNGDLGTMLKVLTSDSYGHAARPGRSRQAALVRQAFGAAEEHQPAPLS